MMKYPYPVYGWDAAQLSRHLTTEQLIELQQAVQNDPKSANPQHAAGKSIWIYTKAARKKMDAISWAITYHIMERKKKEVT